MNDIHATWVSQMRGGRVTCAQAQVCWATFKQLFIESQLISMTLLNVLRCIAVTLIVIALPARAALSLAQFGHPHYPAGFSHFDYANPNAPANGTLNMGNYGELQSYDSLNPFLLRGAPAPDIRNLMFDT